MKNFFNKVDIIWVGLALFISLPLQIIYALIFWNSELFMGHWIFTIIGIVLVWAWLPYAVFRKRN